jgi:signal peptidase I
MTLKWFLSGKTRHATEMCKHVRKLLASQRDILSAEAIREVEKALAEGEDAIKSSAPETVLDGKLQELEKTANRWIKPYANPDWRENVEVLLVAIAVAMAIRTFFLQPFKIPTASMQPTLYGVTAENFRTNSAVEFPGHWERFVDACVHGTFYHELYAPEDCELVAAQATQVARFINKYEFLVRTTSGQLRKLSLWFSPDYRLSTNENWGDLHPSDIPGEGQRFRKGDPIVKLKEVTGDHLFVDRVSYNFRRPHRGDIIVFKTRGIWGIQDQNQFYIKRLAGLGGETIQIGEDRHAIIDGKRLDASTPGFENLYSFPDDAKVENSKYGGHLPAWQLSSGAKFEVRPKHYFALGDNTSVSADSRLWGDLPQENVIGRGFFVYWPISNHGGSRFGLGYR